MRNYGKEKELEKITFMDCLLYSEYFIDFQILFSITTLWGRHDNLYFTGEYISAQSWEVTDCRSRRAALNLAS